jgi:hypothetical protein
MRFRLDFGMTCAHAHRGEKTATNARIGWSEAERHARVRGCGCKEHNRPRLLDVDAARRPWANVEAACFGLPNLPPRVVSMLGVEVSGAAAGYRLRVITEEDVHRSLLT